MSAPEFLVRFDGVALQEKGRTLSLELHPGEKYAIMGPAGSGKTSLLDLFTGDLRPERGDVNFNARVLRPNDSTYSRRATPATVAKANTKSADTAQIVSVLTALHLWEFRDIAFTKLTPGHAMAVDLLPLFLQQGDLAIIDGHLDYCDPWMLDDTLEMIDQHSQDGKSFLITTSRTDIANALGSLIVLKSGVPRFAGTCRELVEQTRPAELTVQLDDDSTVRSMVEPFTVSLKAKGSTLELTSHNGQELAAKLLTEGYGNVKSVIVREPTLDEAIRALY